MEVVRKKMLIKYWDDMYSIGHMALLYYGKGNRGNLRERGI